LSYLKQHKKAGLHLRSKGSLVSGTTRPANRLVHRVFKVDALVCQVQVSLRGGNAFVSQQLCQRGQVNAVDQCLSRERVPATMETHFLSESCTISQIGEVLGKSLDRPRPAMRIDENKSVVLPVATEPNEKLGNNNVEVDSTRPFFGVSGLVFLLDNRSKFIADMGPSQSASFSGSATRKSQKANDATKVGWSHAQDAGIFLMGPVPSILPLGKLNAPERAFGNQSKFGGDVERPVDSRVNAPARPIGMNAVLSNDEVEQVGRLGFVRVVASEFLCKKQPKPTSFLESGRAIGTHFVSLIPQQNFRNSHLAPLCFNSGRDALAHYTLRVVGMEY
jgi:hypothetical protein